MLDKIQLALMVGQNTAVNVLVMLMLMAIGFVLTKKEILTTLGIKQITELVLRTAVPCLIINSYQRDFDPVMASKLVYALVFSVVIHIIYIVISTLIYKKRPDQKDRINKFSIIYSNCGFMALPLIDSLYGSEGVFYAVAYVTVFNILYWTQGIYIYTNDVKQLSFKKAFLTPGVLGAVIGMALFFTGITLPAPIGKTVGFMASLNTPLPMVILGTYLVNLNIKKTLKNGYLWSVTIVRLIALPILTIFVIKLFNMESIMAMPLILASACPAAAVVTLFAVRYDLDSEYATQVVSFTTLLSIITIPVIMMIATLIL
ncbi:MAG: AEC family transporter [Clostridia bacterium]|nr:AEC family transporter [Clostridia bacterium]